MNDISPCDCEKCWRLFGSGWRRASSCFDLLSTIDKFSTFFSGCLRVASASTLFEKFAAISSSRREDSRNALQTHSWWSRWLLLASPSSGIDWITKHRETQVIQRTTQKWKTTREEEKCSSAQEHDTNLLISEKVERNLYTQTKGWASVSLKKLCFHV